jgi:hypothetical protein
LSGKITAQVSDPRHCPSRWLVDRSQSDSDPHCDRNAIATPLFRINVYFLTAISTVACCSIDRKIAHFQKISFAFASLSSLPIRTFARDNISAEICRLFADPTQFLDVLSKESG